jgi:dihydroorotate dehydrogenase
MLGINLGKNKNSTTPTDDYRTLIQQLGPYADYLVINVSCPNVDMKNLGKSTAAMEELLLACQDERNEVLQNQKGSKKKKIPLLVKLSPDLSDGELKDICICLMKIKIDGIIMSNTTSTRPNGLLSASAIVAEQGGLSGKPLKERSTECIRKVYQWTDGSIPIIGVGGIFTGNDVYEKLKAGASMVQVYSGMVYRGPGMVSKLRQELSERMLQDGYRRLDDVIGLDHEDLYWKRKNYKLNV